MAFSISRLPTWEIHLRAYLDQVEHSAFEFGTHDCALFAAACVEAMTGVDPAADFRNTYTNKAGAVAALREHGAGTLLKTVKAWLGEPISPHQAHRGDIVMRDRFTVGICVGAFSWFVGQEQGQNRLIPISTRSCRYAFRVPYTAEAMT